MAKPSTAFVSKRIPLYYQLENLLREKINSGVFSPGDRLPTESDLIHQYGVSRITVRQALTALAEEGLIERRRGRGTFIAERKTKRRRAAHPEDDGRLIRYIYLKKMARIYANQ